MKITIIGAGIIGTTSAYYLAKSGHEVVVIDRQDGPGLETGKFIAPHGLAVDTHGDIYVGEVSYTNWPSTYGDAPMPKLLRSLRKLEKVS